MAYEEAIAGLQKVLSEKSDLGETAAAKVKELTAELAAGAEKSVFDSAARIRTGFEHFKKENYDSWCLHALTREFALRTCWISNPARPL